MKRPIVFVLLMALALSGCAAPADPDDARESIQVIAMDTPMLITTYGEHSVPAAYAAEDCIRELEAELSRTMEDSGISRLNAAGGEAVEVGEDLGRLIQISNTLHQLTDGALDISIAPVVSAWGFATDQFRVPDQAELEELLKLKGRPQFTTPGIVTSVSLAPGQSIDLGAVAKGYAADKLVDLFKEYEVPRGTAQLGGNVLAWGDRPDGTPWRIGVQDPAKPNDQSAFAGVLELTDAFAVTSGGYQRYFEQDGKRWHHIIDPATGYPADSGLTSVTVVADCEDGRYRGTLCDAFSTALFIMGEEKALDFWRYWKGSEDPFELVLVTEDGRVVATEGLADRFTPEESSGYSYETAS